MFFDLPKTTYRNQFVAKSKFSDYANTAEKRLFTELIKKITWTNNLSSETTNLPFKEIDELQIFEVELKQKRNVELILKLIEKAVPYHIILVLLFNEEVMIFTSKKHINKRESDNAVVDWIFKTDWFNKEKSNFKINLKVSLDEVHKDFCLQILNKETYVDQELNVVIENEKKLKKLNFEISRIESQIKKSKQFNKTVDLNMELNELKKKRKILSSN